MRISRLDAFPLRLARDGAAQGSAGSPHALTGGDFGYSWSQHYPALYSRHFESCLVRVELSDGSFGWGEAQAPLAPRVAATIVEDLLRVALVGEEFEPEPARIAMLWDRQYATMRVRGQSGGFMLDAIAGVDLALWNLAARIRGTVERKLAAGERAKPSIEAYVSGLPGADRPARLEFAARHWDAGHRLFKLYFESDWDALLADIDALHQRFPGIRVAIDALWHLPSGRESACAESLVDRGIEWLECPLHPEDLDGHVRLVEETGVRLALGENYRTRFEARPFLEREIVTYWQPDLGRSGMTETLALAQLCRQHGVGIVPHVSIALAPQLHAAVEAAAAVGNCTLCEYNPAVLAMASQFAGEPVLTLHEGAYLCREVPPPIDLATVAAARWGLLV